MKTERIPQCILGNGECPRNCHLYKISAEITTALGDAFDPQESRRRIVFADVEHDINVARVAAVMSSCAKEGKHEVDSQNQQISHPTPL